MSKPINAPSGQKQPGNFDEISQAIAKLEKYSKEECCSEHYQQLSFKYFVKSKEVIIKSILGYRQPFRANLLSIDGLSRNKMVTPPGPIPHKY